MNPLQIFTILTLQLIFFTNTLFAQCPVAIASLGVGNGLQICWNKNQAPASLDSIIYDGVVYRGNFVNGGQGDCWRTTNAATLGVNGNHSLQIIVGGIPGSVCDVMDGEIFDPLPITLAYFGASVEKDAVLIEWQTMEEENNDYFLIERSVDAVNFETIAKVAGAGTAHEIQFYELRDAAVVYQKGVYYYRLKQVDFDGNFTYADVVAVEINKSIDFELTRVFPNPASEQINVLLNLESSHQTQVTILDMTGRVLLEQAINNEILGVQNIPLNIADLQSGCYIVRVQSGEIVQSTQFIKM